MSHLRQPQVRKFSKAYRVRVDPYMQFITKKLPKRTQYEVFTQKTIKRLKSQTINLTRQDFLDIDNEWLSVFINLRMVRTKFLYLDCAMNSQILKYIKQIHFTHLTRLDLSTNVICSVEAIMNMDVVMLEVLDLSDNNLTSAQPIGYANLPRLKRLCLQNNELKSINFLAFMNTTCLQTLQLQMDLYSTNQSTSIRELFLLSDKCPLKQIWEDVENRTMRVEEWELMEMLFGGKFVKG